MFELDDEFFTSLFDEEFQLVTHISSKLLQNSQSKKQITALKAIRDYVEANDEWEKSYNFPHILKLFADAINSFTQLLNANDLTSEEKIFTEVFIAVSKINNYAVQVENSMIMNDVNSMVDLLSKSVNLGNQELEKLQKIELEDDLVSDCLDYLQGYIKYQRGWQIYTELVFLKRNDPDSFNQKYDQLTSELVMIRDELEEDEDIISMTEINSLVQNLKKVKRIVVENPPNLIISNSEHNFNISFYIGNDFANHILDKYSIIQPTQISNELFSDKVPVSTGGIDQLDDFLQTTIGSEYADVLHLILPDGSIELFGSEWDFATHVMIRRFGSVTIQFQLKLKQDLSVSDFRSTQSLVGPQTGISKITWNNENYNRLEEIVNSLHLLVLKSHDNWKENTETIKLLHMDRVDYNPDRNWFSQSLIRTIHTIHNNERKRIFSVRDLENLYEFRALTLPLNEGRPTLDDWIEMPEKDWHNLANIRLHDDDFILSSNHTLTVFLPHDPEFINMGIISSSSLVNDIAALIVGFDSLADVVRSGLIAQVHVAKKQLEEVNINILKRNLNNIRKNVIETTEFELTAKQSIELLRSQNALKYYDHALFIQALIENSAIEATIQNLERKLNLIKENQSAIIRTSDDLLSKYQQEVSASQQRLVKVLTLLLAGFAQISVVDQITDILPISDSTANQVKYGVLGFAALLTIIAVGWLLMGYLRSKKLLFDED